MSVLLDVRAVPVGDRIDLGAGVILRYVSNDTAKNERPCVHGDLVSHGFGGCVVLDDACDDLSGSRANNDVDCELGKFELGHD